MTRFTGFTRLSLVVRKGSSGHRWHSCPGRRRATSHSRDESRNYLHEPIRQHQDLTLCATPCNLTEKNSDKVFCIPLTKTFARLPSRVVDQFHPTSTAADLFSHRP